MNRILMNRVPETDRAGEVDLKVQRVRGWMAQRGFDGVLLATPSNFAWITGGANNYVSVAAPQGVAWLLITADNAFVLANNIELPRMVEEERIPEDFEHLSWNWYETDQPAGTLETFNCGRRVAADVAIDGLEALPEDFVQLRYTMMEPERGRYRLLGRDAADAVEQTCMRVRPGMSEFEIAGMLARACRKRNVLPLVTLVAADDRIARFRHPLPTEQCVGRIVMVVLTGWRWGLHVSLSRLVSFEEIDAQLRAKHDAVTAVDARMILESRPGVSLGSVMRAGIEEYKTQGYGEEWHKHHQGGLTGYAGREIFATPDCQHRLDAWQAVAWNPSITGTKSEDTVLITEDGPEVLTRTGEWPQRQRQVSCGNMERPDILVEWP